MDEKLKQRVDQSVQDVLLSLTYEYDDPEMTEIDRDDLLDFLFGRALCDEATFEAEVVPYVESKYPETIGLGR